MVLFDKSIKYSGPSVIQAMGGGGVPDYPGVRTTKGNLLGKPRVMYDTNNRRLVQK
jgi:hypothetical protein